MKASVHLGVRYERPVWWLTAFTDYLQSALRTDNNRLL